MQVEYEYPSVLQPYIPPAQAEETDGGGGTSDVVLGDEEYDEEEEGDMEEVGNEQGCECEVVVRGSFANDGTIPLLPFRARFQVAYAQLDLGIFHPTRRTTRSYDLIYHLLMLPLTHSQRQIHLQWQTTQTQAYPQTTSIPRRETTRNDPLSHLEGQEDYQGG
jgi:hypothetical protein